MAEFTFNSVAMAQGQIALRPVIKAGAQEKAALRRNN